MKVDEFPDVLPEITESLRLLIAKLSERLKNG
jgi:hypothetical protein